MPHGHNESGVSLNRVFNVFRELDSGLPVHYLIRFNLPLLTILFNKCLAAEWKEANGEGLN